MGKRFAADDAYTAHVSNSKIKSARFGDGLHMVAGAYRRDVSSTSIWCRPTHLVWCDGCQSHGITTVDPGSVRVAVRCAKADEPEVDGVSGRFRLS